MTTLRPASVCDTTPLQRFESQSSSGEEPSSPTAASIIAAVAAAPTSEASKLNHHNNNNMTVKIDLKLPAFVNGGGILGSGGAFTKSHIKGTSQIFKRILLDLAMLSCVGLPMLGLSLWGEPNRRGFFCNDTSLKHPYKESTIRSWMLYTMCAALPIILIMLVEFYRAQDKRLTILKSHNQTSNRAYHLCTLALPEWIVQYYSKIGIFIFGLAVEQLTADVAKYAIGRLRPHFFDLCQPILSDGSRCSDPINALRYIEDFTCSAPNLSPKMLKEMRLSFPSGHSSFTGYAMVYLVIYLQRRMRWKRTKLLRHLLQFALLMFAWYTALTRISDYKHHWSDVLAGAGIGVTYALVVTSTMW